MMLGKVRPLQKGERRYLELRLEDTGRIQISDGGRILVLIDGGGGIPAQIQKDIIGVALGIEENPQAVNYFTRQLLAQRLNDLIGDCRVILDQYVALDEVKERQGA